MQYALQVFEYEDHHPFRMIDRDGAAWFVLVDVCRALDIKNASDAASRLDLDKKMTLALTEGHSGARGGARSVTVINESGLYSLVLRSDKPSAKKFKKWITAEVLPSIRKTGGYHLRGIPAFVRRYNDNWDRVSPGHFSVISELVIRLWGRMEQLGYVMADKSRKGTELRPDVSVGRCFSDPDCPSDAFATAASLAGSRVGWWQGAASSRVPAWTWMAAAPVKAPESLAESQMRQLDNQVSDWLRESRCGG